MNAAARSVHQSVLSRHLLLTYLLSRRQIAFLVLTLSVTFSAFSVVYVTHASRIMHATYQRNLVEQNHLQAQRSRLLLERGSLMMQARIQQVAEKKLGMVVPDHHSVVVVRE